jgi:hypothetical protein
MVPPENQVAGHYYRAERSGKTNGTAPTSFSTDRSTFPDGPELVWKDMGPAVLNPAPAKSTPNNAYAIGAQIVPDPVNGHYYQATTPGVSGPNAPAFPVDGGARPYQNSLGSSMLMPVQRRLQVQSSKLGLI